MRHPEEKPGRTALQIALIYVVLSAIWILFSDLLLIGVSDPELFGTLSIVKGWFFVLVTGVLLYLMVQRTISRILHAEARMALIFNSVNDAIALFYLEGGRPGNFISANRTAIEQLGYTSEELSNMTPLDLIKPELRDEALGAVRELCRTGSAVTETCVLAKDGREIPVEINVKTVRVEGRVMGAAVVRNVAERKRAERERREQAVEAERDKRRFYRETIMAVTGGRFELADPADAKDWIRDPELALHISGPQELANARHEVLEYCRKVGMSEDSVYEFELAVGESLGNAVKHAGEGWLYAGVRDGSIWVAVVDHGKGIDTFMIPKVALLTGFTTKASMGLGYTLILRVCDHVKLATGPEGTTVVMEKSLKPISELEDRLSVFTGIE